MYIDDFVDSAVQILVVIIGLCGSPELLSCCPVVETLLFVAFCNNKSILI